MPGGPGSLGSGGHGYLRAFLAGPRWAEALDGGFAAGLAGDFA